MLLPKQNFLNFFYWLIFYRGAEAPSAPLIYAPEPRVGIATATGEIDATKLIVANDV